MSEDINIESIRKGDRVKVSLYGLPESDWLEVDAVYAEPPLDLSVVMPNTVRRRVYSSEVTAHEPAAPALPEWWGSKVVVTGCSRPQYGVLDEEGPEDGYRFADGAWESAADMAGWAVTVVVDRDGNLPEAGYAEGFRAGQVNALRGFADSTRFPNDWILFRRDDGSGVTVSDLLRETAAKIMKGSDA